MKSLVILSILFFSCTKEYIENPTCRRYLELSDKYDGEMHFLRTDTLWPNGRIANEVCDSDLLRLKNYVPFVEGCTTGGYQEFRYVIE